MGTYGRDEIEAMVAKYKRVALQAGLSGDWTEWANCFTEDATYIDHCMGTFGGRQAILTWIHKVMSREPVREMRYYPWEWYLIDEDRGWVVAKIQNRMTDPGDGSLHEEYNFSLFKYAGDQMWSYEEDIYNPDHMNAMMARWQARREELAARA
jgi:hypothetical protein